jgi:hypothetical protein
MMKMYKWFGLVMVLVSSVYGEWVDGNYVEGTDPRDFYGTFDCAEGCLWCEYEDWGCPWYQFGWGEWMPEDPPLWRPFLADPRAAVYSAAWRFNDNALEKNTIPVSFADYFPAYRWHCVWPYGGDMEIGLEGGVWAVFDPLHESSPLMDADYYVGVPIVYACDNWAFRLRGYHISTHLGDEFLLNHPGFDRRNPSAEYIDLFGHYYFGDLVRVYAGIGFIMHQDHSFPMKKFFSAVGFEIRAFQFGYFNERQQLYGTPYFALHARGSRDFKHHLDSTFALGYEWGKLNCLQRRLRVFLQYHDGYSIDGQFSRHASNYFAIGASYGF